MIFDIFKKKKKLTNDIELRPIGAVDDKDAENFEAQFMKLATQSLKFNSMVIDYVESLHKLYGQSNVRVDAPAATATNKTTAKPKMLEKVKPAPLVWPTPLDDYNKKLVKLNAIINNSSASKEDRAKALKIKYDLIKAEDSSKTKPADSESK